MLSRVPRQMLLVFKTNDLLRGLNHMLGVKDNVISFVTMSRSCASADLEREYVKCNSYISKLGCLLSSYTAYIRITLYQLYLMYVSRRNYN